jgi:hypothetical protein
MQPFDGRVRAFTDAIGKAVGDEQALETRLDQVAQGVVHHTVTKGRGADGPPLGFVDDEVHVTAWFILAANECLA